MEIISVLIRTADEDYGAVLQEVLRRNYRGMAAFLESDGSVSGMPGFDVCLTDEEDCHPSSRGPVLVRLVDSPSEAVFDDAEEKYSLFKYTTAGEMIAGILQIVSHRKGRAIYFDQGVDCQVISIAAAAGGAGCTTLSYALAIRLAAERRARVLHLTLEQFPTAPFTAAGDSVPLRDLLYFALKNDFADIPSGAAMAGLFQDVRGVDHFHLGEGENPLLCLDAAEVGRFLQLATAAGGYDWIVVDLGSRLTDLSAAMTAASDRILFLTTGGSRDRRFFRQLERRGGAGVRAKTWFGRSRFGRSSREMPSAAALSGVAVGAVPDGRRGTVPGGEMGAVSGGGVVTTPDGSVAAIPGERSRVAKAATSPAADQTAGGGSDKTAAREHLTRAFLDDPEEMGPSDQHLDFVLPADAECVGGQPDDLSLGGAFGEAVDRLARRICHG